MNHDVTYSLNQCDNVLYSNIDVVIYCFLAIVKMYLNAYSGNASLMIANVHNVRDDIGAQPMSNVLLKDKTVVLEGSFDSEKC